MADTRTSNTTRKLLISFGANARIEPLIDGAVKPEGVALEWDNGEIGAAFLRALTKNDFDLFEFSISHYIATRTHPNPAYAGWIAIPVFTSKPVFLYRELFVREAAGIESLADLRGKRLGIPDFSMTGGIWIRIMLKTLYGIHPREITWINTRPARLRHDHAMGFDQPTATGIKIINIDERTTPQQMLERGEVDAVVGAPEVEVRAAPGIRHFSREQWIDVLGAVQIALGITPVNHTLIVQKRHLVERPGLAMSMLQAFERSKVEAYRRSAVARSILPECDLDAQLRAFGQDPYPYGLKANRQVLELVADQLVIDGVIGKRPNIDDLVAESVRGS
ncbi:MAG: ABC transporter substrate-binding protein [Burkholderiales bacterium]